MGRVDLNCAHLGEAGGGGIAICLYLNPKISQPLESTTRGSACSPHVCRRGEIISCGRFHKLKWAARQKQFRHLYTCDSSFNQLNPRRGVNKARQSQR